MSTSVYTYSTAGELSDAMDARRVSAVELAQAAIERIERYDGEINAVPVRDFDRALDAARDSDAIRARGESRPLLGVPMTVKESFNIAGLPTTWGILPFKDFIAAEDAVAVTRLKAAGGSSGGSAAALAAGFGSVSIGSDIAGSLRVPAHFSGVYAHKSSFGLLSSRGHTAPPGPPLAYDRDLTVIGPMARGAADLALMLDLLADPDETGLGVAHRLALRPARHDDLASYRVLVVDTHPLIPTSSEMRTVIDCLASDLAAAGARVEHHSALLPDQIEAARIYMRLLLASIAAAYPPDVYEQAHAAAQRVDPSDMSLAAERTRGAALSYRDWVATDTLRARHRAGWRELFTEFDIVLCPAAPTAAFNHDQSADQWTRTISIDGVNYDYADQLVWAGIATAPGLPATVAPIARSRDGLPIGVQLIGPIFEHHTPIRFAELLERQFGGFTPPTLG